MGFFVGFQFFVLGVVCVVPRPSTAILEGLCFNPGFYNVESSKLEGPKDIGWDRLEPTNVDFVQAVWVAPATVSNRIKIEMRYVQNSKGQVLDGFALVHASAGTDYIHIGVLWAVNSHNEPIGEFFPIEMSSSTNNFKIKGGKQLGLIPCSGAPSSSPSVPNAYVHLPTTDSGYQRGRYDVQFKGASNKAEYQQRVALWRASTQTYCHRPSKFRFMFAATKTTPWEAWDDRKWRNVRLPTSINNMRDTKQMGFELFTSEWILPKFFGIPAPADLHPGSATFSAGQELSSSIAFWVNGISRSPLESAWTSEELWPAGGGAPNWNHPDVLKRSTCKSASPDKSGKFPFKGRCEKRLDGSKHFEADLKNQMSCEYKGSSLGRDSFKEEYRDHLARLKTWLEHPCECLQSVKAPVQHYRHGVIDMFTPDGEVDDLPRPRNAEGTGNPVPRRSGARSNIPQWDRCGKPMSAEEEHKAGLCIHERAGIIVFGVRQWHGIASLVQTFICTAVSITVARYLKGNLSVTQEAKVPIRVWYFTHILKLSTPTIWMWVTGVYAITRQTEVVGVSRTSAGLTHRILGYVAFGLFWVNCVSGFLRPINTTARRVLIHFHWWGGLLQHVLELYLCFTSYKIPGSPTQRYSVLNPAFNMMWRQWLPVMVFFWTLLSFAFHLLMTARVAYVGKKRFGEYPSVFPIVKPHIQMAERQNQRRTRTARLMHIEERIRELNEQLEVAERRRAEGLWDSEDERKTTRELQRRQREEHLLAEELVDLDQKEEDDLSEEEAVDYLLKLMVYLYAFFCVSMTAVSIVSLYQSHDAHDFYGLGPMSCTHDENLIFKNVTPGAKSLC